MTRNTSGRTLAAGLAAAAAAVSFAGPVFACGGFFSESSAVEQVVDSTDQRVLFAVANGHVRQYVQVQYSGDAAEFAWVYPVAGNPTVSEGAADIFDTADELTRPRVTIYTFSEEGGGDDGGGCGCFGMAGGSDGLRGGDGHLQDDVQVWSSGQVGAFDYVVLSAETVDPLVEWLTQNGFRIPTEAEPLMAHYVAGDWFFVAMRVSADAAATDGAATTTVVFEYDSANPVFPLHMASLSSADAASILIYVLAEQAYVTAGVPSRRIDTASLAATSASTSNYDDLFQAAIGTAGARRFALESLVQGDSLGSTAMPGGWSAGGTLLLSRIRTEMDVTDMTTDVTLVPSTEDVSPREPYYEVTWSGAMARAPARGGLLSVACTGIVVLFSFRRLRRPVRRRVG